MGDPYFRPVGGLYARGAVVSGSRGIVPDAGRPAVTDFTPGECCYGRPEPRDTGFLAMCHTRAMRSSVTAVKSIFPRGTFFSTGGTFCSWPGPWSLRLDFLEFRHVARLIVVEVRSRERRDEVFVGDHLV